MWVALTTLGRGTMASKQSYGVGNTEVSCAIFGAHSRAGGVMGTRTKIKGDVGGGPSPTWPPGDAPSPGR
jgi:hypothetical protein